MYVFLKILTNFDFFLIFTKSIEILRIFFYITKSTWSTHFWNLKVKFIGFGRFKMHIFLKICIDEFWIFFAFYQVRRVSRLCSHIFFRAWKIHLLVLDFSKYICFNFSRFWIFLGFHQVNMVSKSC
jgi:hypothetical protein